MTFQLEELSSWPNRNLWGEGELPMSVPQLHLQSHLCWSSLALQSREPRAWAWSEGTVGVDPPLQLLVLIWSSVGSSCLHPGGAALCTHLPGFLACQVGAGCLRHTAAELGGNAAVLLEEGCTFRAGCERMLCCSSWLSSLPPFQRSCGREWLLSTPGKAFPFKKPRSDFVLTLL